MFRGLLLARYVLTVLLVGEPPDDAPRKKCKRARPQNHGSDAGQPARQGPLDSKIAA